MFVYSVLDNMVGAQSLWHSKPIYLTLFSMNKQEGRVVIVWLDWCEYNEQNIMNISKNVRKEMRKDCQ